MTNITLPDFVENIRKGYIVVGNSFIPATKIESVCKFENNRIDVCYSGGFVSFKGLEAVEFINKFNSFLNLQ